MNAVIAAGFILHNLCTDWHDDWPSEDDEDTDYDSDTEEVAEESEWGDMGKNFREEMVSLV
jgi:hypothetical protein